jgi:hypothetical protein
MQHEVPGSWSPGTARIGASLPASAHKLPADVTVSADSSERAASAMVNAARSSTSTQPLIAAPPRPPPVELDDTEASEDEAELEAPPAPAVLLVLEALDAPTAIGAVSIAVPHAAAKRAQQRTDEARRQPIARHASAARRDWFGRIHSEPTW